MLGDYASQQQQMEIERLGLLNESGQAQRGMMQQGLDMGYQDYLRQQAYGRDNLGFYNAMLQGLPVTPGSTTTTFGQSPSMGQQMVGAGIGGLGLYNALTGANGGNKP